MKKMKLSLAIFMIQEKYYESKLNYVTKVLSLRNFQKIILTNVKPLENQGKIRFFMIENILLCKRILIRKEEI